MVAAIEHPLVDAIGHPTGRKIETRPPYALDVERVIEAAARTGTMLEINAAPDRRDLNEIHARAAARAGVPILIDSDAHSARNLAPAAVRHRHGAARVADARSRSPTRRPWAEFRRCANGKVPERTDPRTQEEPPMSDGTKDDLKGRTKEAAGSLTDDQSLKNEGKVDRGRARSRTPPAASPTRSRTSSTRTAAERLAQLGLDDLAHRVAGQLVEEAHLARALVRRELGGHVVDQLALAGGSRLGDDPGDDPLAEVVVGRAGRPPPRGRRGARAGRPRSRPRRPCSRRS